MPKKTQRNGFYYFMIDFKKREEQRGNKFASLKDIQADPKCSQEWQELSAEEKKKYNLRAKQDKSSASEKLTGRGESVKFLEKQEDEIQKYEINMREYIDSTIGKATLLDELHLLSFYFVHVNWYYTKIDMNNVVDYIPAEFSVVEFSFNDGVKRCYHDIIKIKVELGYARDAMIQSEATHKIDYYQGEDVTDYKKLYKSFYDFMSYGNSSDGKLPPLYTSRKMKNVVPCLFARMADAAGVPKNQFDVYSLEYLFGTFLIELNEELPQSCNRASLAEAELDKDAFVWTPNIECSYHRKFDGGGPYCSQSVVTQWVYIMCDCCCPLLNIEMINGKHCPCKRNDSLETRMNSLTIKEERIKQIISETGVSEAHRWKVSERTKEENERRKKKGAPLTIIDHSQIREEKPSTIVPSAASSSVSKPKGKQRPLRSPISLSEVFTGYSSDLALVRDDDNFPAIGSHKPKSSSTRK